MKFGSQHDEVLAKHDLCSLLKASQGIYGTGVMLDAELCGIRLCHFVFNFQNHNVLLDRESTAVESESPDEMRKKECC